jgi:hypothetical protein
MALLGASLKLGESIAGLLRMRRDLAAAGGTLAPVPANLEISQTTIGKLVAGAPPTSGIGLVCYDVVRSDHVTPRRRNPAALPHGEIAIEMLFLLIAWSGKPEEEHAALAWAMLELDTHPVLDASLLKGDVWEQGETVQLAPNPLPLEEQFRLWDALGHKYRMAQAYRARVLRLRLPASEDSLPVVASRLAISQSGRTDPETVA